MSRINSSILWDYFDKTNAADKKAQCRVCGDSYTYKGTTGNLKAYLKKHVNAYSRVMTERQEVRATSAMTAATTTANTTATITTAISSTATTTATALATSRNMQQTMDRYGTAKKISSETKR